ncbi:MAG: hypothetical protein PHU05_05100, partial [Bacilli bacterium]|nr:hypothetical protein [Bacilli bacterium]
TGQFAQSNLKISGTNLGTYFIIAKSINLYGGYVGSNTNSDGFEPSLSSTEKILFNSESPGYIKFACNLNETLKILDTSTTFTVRIQRDGGTSVKIKNVKIEVIYVENFEEDA